MTRAQTLAGPMGMASWRAHWILNEYAAAAGGGGNVFSSGGRPRFNHSLDPLGLNEGGVTDAVLATLWQFGPAGAVYGVSARVESRYFGADIAFIDAGRKRILLYQAKLARLDGADLNLKPRVPQSHVGHLTRRSVRVDGDRFDVTGRLALYRADHTPFVNNCAALPFAHSPFSLPVPFGWPWWRSASPAGASVGRHYYEDVLRAGCSPGGVLAAAVTRGPGQIDLVSVLRTWPWEFDIFHWHQRFRGPLDSVPGGSGGTPAVRMAPSPSSQQIGNTRTENGPIQLTTFNPRTALDLEFRR